jgi:hypothetical protein
MLLRVLAGAALLLLLGWAFRLAMGLRWSKIEREAARRREEETGRRVVAELPLPEGVVFFAADDRSLHWGDEAVPREAVLGARLLLNSAVVSVAARPGAALPDAPAPEEEPGREKWEVVAYLRDGRALAIRCGTVREGISREAARAVFDALRQEVQA